MWQPISTNGLVQFSPMDFFRSIGLNLQRLVYKFMVSTYLSYFVFYFVVYLYNGLDILICSVVYCIIFLVYSSVSILCSISRFALSHSGIWTLGLMVLLILGLLSIVTTTPADPTLTSNLRLLWCATHHTQLLHCYSMHHTFLLSSSPPPWSIIDHSLMPPHIQQLGPRCWDTRWATLSPSCSPTLSRHENGTECEGKGMHPGE